MVICPRIVFLVDRNQGKNHDNRLKKIMANINLSCLRILSYFRYPDASKSMKSSVLWGYKFYNSSEIQDVYHYKQCNFLEFSSSNFDKFENELYKGISSDAPTATQQNHKPGERLRVALTEIITDYQWDRPELFSPGKMWKKGDENNEIQYKNLVFLFTYCPTSLYDSSSYFDKSYEDCETFMTCLFPAVHLRKFVEHLSLKLYWIDTGICYYNKQIPGDDHDILEKGMRKIGGCFVEMRYLASWWVHHSENNNHVYSDMINVTSLVKGLLNPLQCDEDVHISKYKLSSDDEDYGNDVFISLCSTQTSNAYISSDENETKFISMKEVIDLKDISLKTLSDRLSFFYVVNPNLSESNRKLLLFLNEKYVSRKAIKLQFSPPNSIEIFDAVMIPYAPFCGTIIALSFMDTLHEFVINNQQQTMHTIMLGEKDDDTKDKETSLQKHLDKIIENQNFGTSLVSVLDVWFLSNPKLGFPPEIKNILCSLCDKDIEMNKKREENSKTLVEYMKEMYLNPNFKLKNKLDDTELDSSKVAGISLAQQRLTEHRLKVKKEKDELEKSISKEESISKCDEPNFQKLHSEEELKVYVESEYERLLKRTGIYRNEVYDTLKTVVQYFQLVDPASYKVLSYTFLNSTLLQNVTDIRDKNLDISKDELVKEYLLQVQLHLECVSQLSLTEDTNILKQIVSFLRTVSFEKSTVFVRDHLNAAVLPRFLSEMAIFLHEIYENLMIDIPEELKDGDETISPIKSVQSISSVLSYFSPDHSPQLSFNNNKLNEKRTLKRLPSIVGDNNNKKVIAVQVRKVKDKTTKKNIASVSTDKVVKRSLFSHDVSMSDVLATPTPIRQKSESFAKKRVPDTPETKQINDMIWKKQDRKRRYSKVEKTNISIEESPLKEIVSNKFHSSFHRSNSFSCHTSPRRFYPIQRHSSTLSKDSKLEHGDVISDSQIDVFEQDSLEVKLRRRSTLFSNFDNETIKSLDAKYEKCFKASSRNVNKIGADNIDNNFISNGDITPVKCGPFNSSLSSVNRVNFKSCKVSLFDKSSKRIKLSDSEHPLEKQNKNTCIPLTNDGYQDKNIQKLENGRPNITSEDTVDWLDEIEKNQSTTPTNFPFHDVFDKFPKIPGSSNLQSPVIVKAGNDSITVSPCLSAISLEVLEKAPIISPVIIKQKLKKGRLLNSEY